MVTRWLRGTLAQELTPAHSVTKLLRASQSGSTRYQSTGCGMAPWRNSGAAGSWTTDQSSCRADATRVLAHDHLDHLERGPARSSITAGISTDTGDRPAR